MSLPQGHESPDPGPDPLQLLPLRSIGAAAAGALGAAAVPPVPAPTGRTDWDGSLSSLGKKRKAFARVSGDASQLPALDDGYVATATLVSFALDGVALAPADVEAALTRAAPPPARAIRSRQSHRVRNHVAVLRRVDRLVRRGEPLEPDDVIRWYASIACGLSTAAIDGPTRARLGDVVARVNSPQLRLRSAIEDAAALHLTLLSDPFVPAFNGILARVLLHAHLNRCGLPPVLFEPEIDANRNAASTSFPKRLLELLIAAYDRILG